METLPWKTHITCDLCKKLYPKSERYVITDYTDESLSGKFFDIPDGEYINYDLCEDCRKKLVAFLKNPDKGEDAGTLSMSMTRQITAELNQLDAKLRDMGIGNDMVFAEGYIDLLKLVLHILEAEAPDETVRSLAAEKIRALESFLAEFVPGREETS